MGLEPMISHILVEDLDAETGVEPVNDGFADRSLNRLGTPRFAYDEDATPSSVNVDE